jgi:(p)ppGpp synthase/HD superfamily hydrolase
MRTITPLVQKAVETAAVLHYEQKRKGSGLPFIIHPFSVAYIVSRYTDDETIIAAAFLHDVLEDVGHEHYNAEDMKRDFGDTVLALVQSLSEPGDPHDSRETKTRTWYSRKVAYFAQLNKADEGALIICAADKIHNLSTLVADYKKQGETLWTKFDSPADKRLWFYEESLRILQAKLNNPIVDELAAMLEEVKPQLGW